MLKNAVDNTLIIIGDDVRLTLWILALLVVAGGFALVGAGRLWLAYRRRRNARLRAALEVRRRARSGEV